MNTHYFEEKHGKILLFSLAKEKYLDFIYNNKCIHSFKIFYKGKLPIFNNKYFYTK